MFTAHWKKDSRYVRATHLPALCCFRITLYLRPRTCVVFLIYLVDFVTQMVYYKMAVQNVASQCHSGTQRPCFSRLLWSPVSPTSNRTPAPARLSSYRWWATWPGCPSKASNQWVSEEAKYGGSYDAESMAFCGNDGDDEDLVQSTATKNNYQRL